MNDWFMDYAEHLLRMLTLDQNWLELRYNHNHDEKGRFCSGIGGGAVAQKVDNSAKSGIINIKRMHREKDNENSEYHYLSRDRINQLTVEARKNGAEIIIDDPWFNERMEKENASAVTYGDIIVFGKNATISDVLEETHHFMQNKKKMNDDKSHELREILNEIDAKQFLLDNAKKYKIPRNETELTKKQLESYQQRLKAITDKKG